MFVCVRVYVMRESERRRDGERILVVPVVMGEAKTRIDAHGRGGRVTKGRERGRNQDAETESKREREKEREQERWVGEGGG